ncbi:hypothetical protein Cgig2_006728 [Carnegiea gigantea]|uniref:Uncharacterized protein n=1 Tax=Carnegiea gigantea TaxID=171969 RepID=A0A9Q1JPD4_9CARY|nr:hypothetical protein Cgig2_006728 [Carnegiea gigantea]
MLLAYFRYLAGQVDMAQRHASITATNKTQGKLQRVRGDQNAPKTIIQGNSVFFVSTNSKGYVIYEGTNIQGGSFSCGWLLAWNALGHGNQVYAQCGAIGIIKAIPDHEIYDKVEASKNSSTAVDPNTHTSATALIDAIAETPALGCSFAVDN